MKNILATDAREVLEQLAWSNVLLGFDFDGTLAPLVADRERAKLAPATRKLLADAAKLYPCVVISGRSIRDVQGRLAGIAFAGVVGNHGLEPMRASSALAARVRRWRGELEKALDGQQGVQVEDKTYSLAVHFRRARKKREARERIAAAVAELGPVRVIGGKQVINVVPSDAPHKGLALERERRRIGCDTALFVGDDETDEDVFALDRPGRLVTVRVGASSRSHASYFVRDRAGVDELVRRLIELRSGQFAAKRRAAR